MAYPDRFDVKGRNQEVFWVFRLELEELLIAYQCSFDIPAAAVSSRTGYEASAALVRTAPRQ